MLVVDDEPDVCDCIRLLLTYEGHEVTSANSGRAALAAFENEKFDVVVTDYFMPGMKGDELAAAIKMRTPSQPVMMISGFIPEPNAMSAVDFVLSKPFGLDDLRDAIDRVSKARDCEV